MKGRKEERRAYKAGFRLCGNEKRSHFQITNQFLAFDRRKHTFECTFTG